MYTRMIDNVSYERFGVFEKKKYNNVFVTIDACISFNSTYWKCLCELLYELGIGVSVNMLLMISYYCFFCNGHNRYQISCFNNEISIKCLTIWDFLNGT